MSFPQQKKKKKKKTKYIYKSCLVTSIYIYISNYYLLGHVNKDIIHLFLGISFFFLIIFLFIKFSFYNYTSSNIPQLLPFYIPSTLYFNIAILLSLCLSFILTFFLPTLFTRKF